MSHRDLPITIEVPFEYENSVKTSYYSLELEDGRAIDRVGLAGVEGFCAELDTDEADDVKVSFWVPTEHGWGVAWRMSASEFLSRARLVEIKRAGSRT